MKYKNAVMILIVTVVAIVLAKYATEKMDSVIAKKREQRKAATAAAELPID